MSTKSVQEQVISPVFHDSQQAQPNYVIAFIPFVVRDTFYSKTKASEALRTENPLVVVNDAIHISIHQHKGNPLLMAEITLQSGTVNYAAQIAPGDHALIWLMNRQSTFDEISKAVYEKRSKVNTYLSGLKFVGRVNSVRQILQVSPRDGKKVYRYHISLAGFSELQSQIYYNELLSASQPNFNTHLKFLTEVSDQYRNLLKTINEKGRLSTEDVINFFLDVFMGPGPKDVASKVNDKMHSTPNAAFLIPSIIPHYLGIAANKKSKNAIGFQYSDLLQRIMGIQVYEGAHYPKVQQVRNNYFQASPLHGSVLINTVNFNNITLWSLLMRYMNPALNEMYTVLKYNPIQQGIMPTLVLRQLPFTTEKMKNKYKPGEVTFFTNVHRWKLTENYPIFEYNLGTSDAERFNYFQIYTTSIGLPTDANDPQKLQRLQIAMGNYAVDESDIYRSGVRTFILTVDTDALIMPSGQAKTEAIKQWVNMVSDFYANGHLKLNGSITVAGIQSPICIGDNLEFDNKLFHIEGIRHEFRVDTARGSKSFLTTLVLSHGYYLDKGMPVYITSTAQTRAGQANEQHLPGFTYEEYYVNDVLLSSSSQQKAPIESKQDQPAQTVNNKLQRLRNKLSNRK